MVEAFIPAGSHGLIGCLSAPFQSRWLLLPGDAYAQRDIGSVTSLSRPSFRSVPLFCAPLVPVYHLTYSTSPIPHLPR